VRMKRALRKLRRFLERDLWEIPEVVAAVRELEKMALEHDWYPTDLIDFELMYEPGLRSLTVVFSAPPAETLDEGTTRKMHELQDVIATAVQSFVLKTLEAEGLPWEVVNEL